MATAADKVDIKIINSQINSNQAKGGSGGFFYMPITSLDSTVTVDNCGIASNKALIDGGVFYIGGAATSSKILKMTNLVKLENQVTTNGNGAVAFIQGLYSEILVENPTQPS